MRMKGRNALVTGASKGIGLAVATNFAMAGANVIILGRRQDALEEAKDIIVRAGQTKVIAISADVSKAEDCARAFAEGEQALGQIDVVVNNAGKSQTGPFESATDAI